MFMDFSDRGLSKRESHELAALLERQDPAIASDLEQMWYLLDLVWDELGCDNRRLDQDKLVAYYSHPVWLLNGLFIEQDEESMRHRRSIASHIGYMGVEEVVDYGGGFSTLARTICDHDRTARVFVYEPYPSDYGLKRASEYAAIAFIDGLREGAECLVSTDVLEHLEDPLVALSQMIDSVRLGGSLLIAAPFYPMIKCHLPQNFHFRYSLRWFCLLMGAEKKGTVAGAPHVTVYVKARSKDPNWWFIRASVVASRAFYLLAEMAKHIAKLVTS